MPDPLPASVPVLVIGAGVHGLSTAWHAARQGRRVLVVDKTGVGAGASGIACGFEGGRACYRDARSGGVGAFTVDNFPVFDYMGPNVSSRPTPTTATR